MLNMITRRRKIMTTTEVKRRYYLDDWNLSCVTSVTTPHMTQVINLDTCRESIYTAL
jgi:hypothetical protein